MAKANIPFSLDYNWGLRSGLLQTTLWTWSEEEGSKLYVFPYDQDTAQELEEAEGKMGDGQLQGGSFSDTAERDSPGLEMDDWYAPDTEVTK